MSHMIYMVEMALLDIARRAEWDAWYVAHQHHLLTIPGIHASQRFECVHAAAAPFVALHEVDGPQVFTSNAYRDQAGPSNTGARSIATRMARKPLPASNAASC